MKTNWDLIRSTMNAALDACERFEQLNLTEDDRSLLVDVGGRQVSVGDILNSAWVYPESVRRQTIALRHEDGSENPYVSDTARAIVNVAQACVELIGAGATSSTDKTFQAMELWYRNHAVPLAEAAVQNRPLPTA